MKLCNGCKIEKTDLEFSKSKARGLQGYCKACAKRWKLAHPRRWVPDTYGITPEEYDQRLATQHGLCACCGHEMEQACLDHNHVTGALRQFLCMSCNCGIGLLGDSVEGITRALEYLKRHEEGPSTPLP